MAGAIDRQKLTAADAKIYDQNIPSLSKATSIRDNINAVEELRLLAKAMDLIRETNLADLDQSAGDPDAVGNTLMEMQKAPDWDKRMTTRVGAWAMLDKKYPSTMENNLHEMAQDLRCLWKRTMAWVSLR
jgi:hypothetical protein